MVDYIQAIILAIIQGITEWLPISSSGHLAIAQYLFGISPPLFFDISLHFGTLISVVAFFWKDILNLVNRVEMILFIVIASVPTAIIGLTMKDFFAGFYNEIWLVGIALLLTGAFLYLTKYAKSGKTLNPKLALIIGIAQGLAVAPGISRAGSTIGAGMLLGIDRELAARFSFILSIPAILGATVIEGADLALSSIEIGPTLLGIIVAAIVGYLTIGFLLGIIRKGNFSMFSYYCFALGIITIILGLI
jgi:undecaprenyl-diphosphatase